MKDSSACALDMFLVELVNQAPEGAGRPVRTMVPRETAQRVSESSSETETISQRQTAWFLVKGREFGPDQDAEGLCGQNLFPKLKQIIHTNCSRRCYINKVV